MTNNSTESNKNPDSGFNNNMTTDTPRTDASLTEQEAFVSQGLIECCRTLERKLTLQKEITKGWLISRDVILEERDKLQAEVERLKSAHFDEREVHCSCVPALRAEVESLKRMVMEAAELGDKRVDNFKSRAEKAEASLIKINEELCQAGLREYGN
jgi:hypothetical protein